MRVPRRRQVHQVARDGCVVLEVDARRGEAPGRGALAERPRLRTSFSVGVCASDDARNLGTLLAALLEEPFSEGFELKRVVTVASGCTESVLGAARGLTRRDPRFILVEETVRRGKAEALNTIIGACREELIVFVNADSLPERGAIGKLLEVMRDDEGAGVVSGHPVFGPTNDITSQALSLMWEVHNECSLDLNHRGMSNHCSDELMAVRSEAVDRLPGNLVNDGAYIAGSAFARGYSVKFSGDALVRIDVPSRFVDVIEQRRRITFGHFQVWRLLGRPPRTVESLLVSSPRTSLGVVVRALAGSPGLIRVLPLALVGEFASFALAVYDTLRSTRRHVVWKRYGARG